MIARARGTAISAGSKVSPAPVRLSAIAIAALLGGCGSSGTEMRDATVGRDAMLAEGGIHVDAGEPDAGGHDAMVAVDAGGWTVCAMGTCDPREPLSSCGGMGVCVLRDRLPVCVTRSGELAEGSACSMTEDCAPGLACFATHAGSICARVCCPSSDDPRCGLGMRCSADGRLSSGTATSWGRCALRTPCDLFAPEVDCAPREGCYIVYPRRADEPQTECRFAGGAEVGDPCLEQNDCRPGLFCAGLASRSCVRICRLADPESCPAGEGRCVAQAYSPEGTGVCVVSTVR